MSLELAWRRKHINKHLNGFCCVGRTTQQTKHEQSPTFLRQGPLPYSRSAAVMDLPAFVHCDEPELTQVYDQG